MTDIPRGWARATIADTGRYVNGLAFKPSDWEEEGRPIIRIQNLSDEAKPFNYTTKEFESDFLVEDGDFLVSWSATLDVFRWNRGPAVLNQHIFKVVPESRLLHPRFLFYLLRHTIGAIRASFDVHGSTMRHINRGPFLATEVLIPPLAEQDRIVAEIEKHLTRLDAAVGALQRLRANLKRYRASVLKAAVEGQLVPTEAELARAGNKTFDHASEQLERIRQRPKRQHDNDSLPEGWATTSVEELTPKDRSCAYGVLQPGPPVDGGVPMVRVGDISYGRIEVEALKPISPVIAAEYKRTFLRGGEVLITLVGAIGRTAVVPSTLEGANVARAVGVIPLVKGVNSNWVELWFRNPAKVAEMTGLAHEVARKTLNLEDVRSAQVDFPPLDEQHRIVAEVERRFSVIDSLEQAAEHALMRAELLRQSVLKRAFEGRLVAQDSDDEPASVLLERIRTEREKGAGLAGRRVSRRQTAVQPSLPRTGSQ